MNNIVENIKFAEEYIEKFKKTEVYDHYASLEGTESMKQKLYDGCVKFLDDINKANDSFEYIKTVMTKFWKVEI